MRYRRVLERDFPWLVAVESDGSVTGMMCKLRKRHKTNNQSTVWSSTPCTYFCDSLGCHKKCSQHLEAVKLETHHLAAERSGGIRQAFQA